MTLRPSLWVGVLAWPLAAAAAPAFPDAERVCAFDAAREARRAESARQFPQPVVRSMLVNGVLVWRSDGPMATPTLRPRDVVVLRGSGFGAGPDVDFSKIMIGNSRVLETDLTMYEQKLDILSQVNYETTRVQGRWPRDVLRWQDDEVEFRVPEHASRGPLVLQVQKRTGAMPSLLRPGQPHNVMDAQAYRIPGLASYNCDVVSELSAEVKATAPIAVQVDNAGFAALQALGRKIFWSFDFNIGLAHKVRDLDWTKIFAGKTLDPIERKPADPKRLFGAIPTVAGEVPPEAMADVYFKPYPQRNPIPGFLTLEPQLTEGNTRNSGFVGYRYAESSHPFNGKGQWIGFNCASCHGYKISYSKGLSRITKVFPGLPNPEWTMKWAVLGDKAGRTPGTFEGIVSTERGPSWRSGLGTVDRSALVWVMPAGTGEHNIIRKPGEGSLYDTDYMFSPVAIPNVTHHLPIRRSLSHTESYVGFEGSYVHSEEPDGATGAMDPDSLKALTAYMTTLDGDDDDLRNVGLFRWLKGNGRLAQTGSAATGEGSFVQAGWKAFPGVAMAVARGQATFARDCASCHSDKLGAHTNERMFRLDQVGRFFAPTDYHVKQQSIRAAFLRNLYWVSSRGLLSDGHVRNLEDLVHPDRCTEGTALYQQYYTLHAPARPAPGTPDQPTPHPDLNRKGDVFRVYRSKPANLLDLSAGQRNLFIERHKYFVTVPWDSAHYYWDYQKMRREYGPEMGAAGPIGLPAAPHPWCARSAAEVMDLTQYLLTL